MNKFAMLAELFGGMAMEFVLGGVRVELQLASVRFFGFL